MTSITREANTVALTLEGPGKSTKISKLLSSTAKNYYQISINIFGWTAQLLNLPVKQHFKPGFCVMTSRYNCL